VIGTSGPEKLDKLKAMGLDVGIRTRSGDFAKAVLDATGRQGRESRREQRRRVGVPGNHSRARLRGRTRPSATSTESLRPRSTSRHCTPSGSRSSRIQRLRTPEQRAVTVRGFAADVCPSSRRGKIKPLVDRVFPFAELPAAKAYMESNAQVGKIAVRIAG